MNTMRIFLAPLLAAAILAGCTDPVGPQDSGIDAPRQSHDSDVEALEKPKRSLPVFRHAIAQLSNACARCRDALHTECLSGAVPFGT